MKQAFIALVCCALCWGQAKSDSAKAGSAPKAATKGTAKKSGLDLMNPATIRGFAPSVYIVKLDTTKGPIVIRVTRNWAPIGADQFYNLVRAGFYNNTVFFRATDQFVQFGISGRPEISRVWSERTINDDRVVQSNRRGTLTYGSTGEKNSRGTQLFINKVNNTYLDSMGFAPIGEVIEGLDVVDMLYSGYGEQVTNLQGQIITQGNAFLEKSFPRLDRIKTATIEPVQAPAAAK